MTEARAAHECETAGVRHDSAVCTLGMLRRPRAAYVGVQEDCAEIDKSHVARHAGRPVQRPPQAINGAANVAFDAPVERRQHVCGPQPLGGDRKSGWGGEG